MTPGQDIRANGGAWRIAYRPDWSSVLPYVTYRSGTAIRHFGSLHAAKASFERGGVVTTAWSDPA